MIQQGGQTWHWANANASVAFTGPGCCHLLSAFHQHTAARTGELPEAAERWHECGENVGRKAVTPRYCIALVLVEFE